MIQTASKEDKAEIRRLWDMCFNDEEDFNNWFFTNRFKSEYCLVLREDGIIKAMAQMLPYEISALGKVTYIYGAATHPDYRKMGLMRALLERSFENDIKNGCIASVLIPANKNLFEFYKKLGYKTVFYVGKGSAAIGEYGEYALRDAKREDIPFMNSLYEKESGAAHIVRTYDYWEEQIEMFRKLGGGVLILTKRSDPCGYAFVSDNTIQEALGEAAVTAYLAGIAEYTSCKGDIPIGMARIYKDVLPKKMYLNLMFN